MSEAALPEVITADYLVEARELSSLPGVGPVEIAISGRSNVGKSTLLNRLAGRKALARTSKTPGRTRGMIFYELGVRLAGETDRRVLRLVDLPGYGYAQVSRDERHGWGALIEGYVKNRPTLKLVVVLVDARRGIEADEQQLFEWLASLSIPHHLALTKVDKLSAVDRGGAKARCRAAFGKAAAPPLTLVSGSTGEGVASLWHALLRVSAP